jgi:electron transfer flavoprotein beta subunit
MNIAVCIKQVPDTNEVRIDPKTGTLIREGVPSIINPDDKNALEEALGLKERLGGTVTVVTMGPPQAETALREALGMGADRAILVADRAFAGADTLATSRALAAAMRRLEFDILLAGRQAIDGDTAQVGPELAEHLDLPQVTYVEKVDVDGKSLRIRRATEEGHEEVTVGMPVLLTAIKELNTPRYMNMVDIFASGSKAVEVWTAADLGVDKALVGLSGSPTRVKKSQAKDAKRAGITVNAPAKEAAERVAYILREKRYL